VPMPSSPATAQNVHSGAGSAGPGPPTKRSSKRRARSRSAAERRSSSRRTRSRSAALAGSGRSASAFTSRLRSCSSSATSRGAARGASGGFVSAPARWSAHTYPVLPSGQGSCVPNAVLYQAELHPVQGRPACASPLNTGVAARKARRRRLRRGVAPGRIVPCHERRIPLAPPRAPSGTSLALEPAASGAAGAPKEVEMQRITRAVAVGLLCGLALAGTGRGAVAAGAAPAAAGARVDLNSAGADGRAVVGRLEDCGARDENVGARGGCRGGVVRLDAPVHLDDEAGAGLAAQAACGGELLQGALDEGLPAPTGVDAHHQQEVDPIRERTDALEGRGRVERQPRTRAGPADGGQGGREEAVEAVAVRQGAEVSRGREEIARQRGPLEHEGGVRALEPLDHVLVLLARERADRVHEQAAGADERGNTRQDLPLERGEARDVLRAPPPA